MKRVVFIALVLILISARELKGQSEGTNIWDITSDFLVRNGEKESGSEKYPSKTENSRSWSLFLNDLTQRTEIEDPSYLIPKTDSLMIYGFSALSPHAPYHLMFVKNGIYRIINMRDGLIGILEQGVSASEFLCLDDDDVFAIFQEILNRYEVNLKNRNDNSAKIVD